MACNFSVEDKHVTKYSEQHTSKDCLSEHLPGKEEDGSVSSNLDKAMESCDLRESKPTPRMEASFQPLKSGCTDFATQWHGCQNDLLVSEQSGIYTL